ncbi:hypothetical protein NMY22_g9961 [Coprinellus aureogranulatus]|nr:hypothetical protein NMY22_g9961 [Coprinellus aureogranulatus]
MYARSLLLPTLIAVCAYLAFPLSFSFHRAASVFKPARYLRTMSSRSPSEWVKSQFETLFANPQDDGSRFQSVFSDSFSNSPTIKYNDKNVSLDEFKEQLEMGRFAVQQANMHWQHIAEHPSEEEGQSIVFGSFKVTRLSKIRIRAAPAEHRQSVSFEAKLEKTGKEDGPFKFAEVSLSSEDEAAPVHLADIPGQTS